MTYDLTSFILIGFTRRKSYANSKYNVDFNRFSRLICFNDEMSGMALLYAPFLKKYEKYRIGG